MMQNRDLIKILVELDMDAPVFTWSEQGIREVSMPTTSDGVPEWQKEKVNLPAQAIVFPV